MTNEQESAHNLDQQLAEYVVETYSPYKERYERTAGLDSQLAESWRAIQEYMDMMLDKRFALNVVLGVAKEEEKPPLPEAAETPKQLTTVRFQLSTDPVPEYRDHWTVLIDHYGEIKDERQW